MFIDLNSDPAPGITDGMRVDVNGNLWETGPGGIWIISPEGKHLGTILLPELGANVEFGDADRKTLYIAARTSIYRIRSERRWHPLTALLRRHTPGSTVNSRTKAVELWAKQERQTEPYILRRLASSTPIGFRFRRQAKRLRAIRWLSCIQVHFRLVNGTETCRSRPFSALGV